MTARRAPTRGALFGDEGGTYANGYEKLSALKDTDGNGTVEGAELDGLAIWVDDGDGVLEAGEIVSLADQGITELDTSFTVDAEGRMVSETKQNIEATGEVTYSIEGADAQFFQIDAATGELTYAAGFVPDFENPQDQGGDNVYDVTVVRTVADTVGCVKEALREDVQIKVQDKPELGAICGTYFTDGNNDSLQGDPSDGVVQEVQVLLFKDGAPAGSAVFGQDGTYKFADLEPGDYEVVFDALFGNVFVEQDVDGNAFDGIDSDVDANGVAFVTVVGGETAIIDAGIEQEPTQPSTVVANDDSIFVDGSTLIGDSVLTTNDFDPEGDDFFVFEITASDGSTVSVPGSGGGFSDWLVTPEGALIRVDADGALDVRDPEEMVQPGSEIVFEYSIEDETGAQDSAFVTLDIQSFD